MSFDRRPAEIDAAMAFKVLTRGEIDGVRACYPARADALDQALRLVLDTGSEPKAREINDRISQVTDRWLLPLLRCRSTIPMSELNKIIEAEAAREMQFFAGLANTGVGEARDRLIALEAGLNLTIIQLQLKWDAMTVAAKDLEAAEVEANDKANKIIGDAQKDAVEAWLQVGKAADDFLGAMVKLPDVVNAALVAAAIEAGIPPALAAWIPKVSLVGKDYFAKGKELGLTAGELAKANPEAFRDPGMAVSEEVQRAIGPWFEYLVAALVMYQKYISPEVMYRYRESLAGIQAKFPMAGAVLISFTETRKDVDRFLQENGLAQAREVFEKADRALTDWVSSMPSDGLKADAAEFAEKAREANRRRYENMANLFGVFVQSNQGRFTGSVSKEVENQLIFTEVWANREAGQLNEGMDQRLVGWRDAVTKIDDVFKGNAFTQAMKNVPEDLFFPINYKLNELQRKLQDKLGVEIRAAQSGIEQARTVVAPEKAKAAVSRRPLQAILGR